MGETLPPKPSNRKANRTLTIETLGNLNHDETNEPELSVTQSTHQWLANNLAHPNRLSSQKVRMHVLVIDFNSWLTRFISKLNIQTEKP